MSVGYYNKITDRELNNHIQDYVESFHKVRRKVFSFGYVQTNYVTYEVGRLLCNNEIDDAKELIEKGNVEMHNLEHLVDYTRKNGVEVLQFDFDDIIRYDGIYFRQRNMDIDKLVRKHYRVDTSELNYQTLDEKIDMLTEIKFITFDEHEYDLLSDELDLLEGVQDFMQVSEKCMSKIRTIVSNHKRAIEIEINRAKRNYGFSDYFKIKKTREGQLANLKERITGNFSWLMNLNEN